MIRFTPLLLSALLCICGCGGGGGSEECNDSVACIQPDRESNVDSTALVGSYDITYTLSSNSCPGAAPLQRLNEQYDVTTGFGYHGFPTIEVSSSTDMQYTDSSTAGNTDGKTYFNSLQVGEEELPGFVPGKNCVAFNSLHFTNLGQMNATVSRISNIECADPGAAIVQGTSPFCQVAYDGGGEFRPQQ